MVTCRVLTLYACGKDGRVYRCVCVCVCVCAVNGQGDLVFAL